MLLNRLAELWRSGSPAERSLRARAYGRTDRVPVLLVPSLLGVRLRDADGRLLWGDVARVYASGPFDRAPSGPAGLLAELRAVPGLWAYDIYGGLVRFLQRVGGYRLGEDLHVLDYDWRTGHPDGADALAARVRALRGAGAERFDLVCVSSGGNVARHYLASERHAQDAAAAIRRVVYVGTPHRGTVSAIEHLVTPLRLTALARLIPTRQMATMQTVWDSLPHPDEPTFVDGDGAPLSCALYDPAAWRAAGLPVEVPDLEARLAAAHRAHRILDAARAHPDTIVIGATHRPTPARCVLRSGAVQLPPCEPPRHAAYARVAYEPGDGSVVERSLVAVPGLDSRSVWRVSPRAHHHLPSEPAVHRLVLEALLATERAIPRGASYDWGTRLRTVAR